MRRKALAVAMLLGVSPLMLAPSGRTGVAPFPPGFLTEDIKTDSATIHVRVGGAGPAVVLLHGFGDTGDMWAPVAAALAGGHATWRFYQPGFGGEVS